jgi:hypothetical protein
MLPVNAGIEAVSAAGRPVYAVRLRRGPRDLSWAEVLTGWNEDAQLRDVFSTALASAPLDAFFWETVPVSRETRDQPFQSVLVHAPTLVGVPPDTRSFAGKLSGATAPDVFTFPNLGRDARLVVPAPAEHPASHVHLACFLRQASSEQIHRLWQGVGRAVDSWFDDSSEPVWVSTSGAGVYWLHIRLDKRPKYICYGPFRSFFG